MTCREIIKLLQKQYNPKNVEGMARFGIASKNTLGIAIPFLRGLAEKIGTDHALALELWETGIHEARILAGIIADPELITQKQMDSWAKDFDSWDICDCACTNLFDRSKFALKKIYQWHMRKEEFVKRASFSTIAGVTCHNRKLGNKVFIKFFPLIKKASIDERNFVKKAVNWALRNIGKRNSALNKQALKFANTLLQLDSKSARWIAKDAVRELSSPQVLKRLAKKNI